MLIMILLFINIWIALGTIYWLSIYLLYNAKLDNKNVYTDIDRALQLTFLPITGIVCALNYILYGNLKFLR